MFFYFSITIFCALLMYYAQHIQKRTMSIDNSIYYVNRNKYLYVIPFIPLLLVSALRYGIGTDYFHTYYPSFYRIRNGYSLGFSFELGYLWLNKIVARFSDDVAWVVAICAIIFFIFLGKAIVEQSENPALSLLLVVGTGLFAFSMNGMRQSIAIAAWFYSIKYIKQQKFIPFLICMLTSSLFHASGILMIPFYFVYRINLKPKVVIIAVTATAVFSPIFRQIILYIAKFTKYYNKFIGTILVKGDFAYSNFFVMLAVLLFLLLFYRRLNNVWEYNFFLMSTTIGTVCSILTKDIFIILRILVFFQYIPALYLPHTLKVFNKSSRKITAFAFVVVYFLYIWFMAGYLGKGDTVPYQSIFNR